MTKVGQERVCDDGRMTSFGQEWVYRGWMEHSDGRQNAFADGSITNLGQERVCGDGRMTKVSQERVCGERGIQF